MTTVLASGAWAQDTDKIYVDAGTRQADISKSMYGVFFEEINHAGDGGLYGELLQNRGFEEQVIPRGTTYNASDGKVYCERNQNYYGMDITQLSFPWDMEAKKMQGWQIESSGCTLQHDVVSMDTPLDEATPHAMQLVVSNASAGSKVILANTGYWGVPTKQDATYKLRFYLCTSDYQGKVNAYLYDTATNESIGGTTFDVTSDGEWTEYTATLTASATQTTGQLRLEFSGNGTIDVDYVSLFPTDTYKGRENGLRKDVAEMLAGLQPKFMRWPGGCIVEGLTLENRVRWKETIDPDPMKRPGEYSLWGYRSTWGLGYHEFLQLCEDMGMDAMFVDNAGMACSLKNGDFVTGEDNYEKFYEDIRDAIEYAIGDPATNEWAAKRAARGHSDPFPLKYVEIGNENGTPRYIASFNYIYQKLKAEYPQITFITSLCLYDYAAFGNGTEEQYKSGEKARATDMIDHHWYVEPDYFFNNVDMFDSTSVPHDKFTVYVGEYACNNGVGQGTLEAALSESAFMMNMERNSDFVKMASYAPLFVNTNQPNWACNLIWLNNTGVMGRASYYTQKMFAENRPDYNLRTQLYSNLLPQAFEGRIGLGSWLTSAKFKSVKVTGSDGTVSYQSDFTNKASEWTPIYGTWTAADGMYEQTDVNETGTMAVLNTTSFSSGTIEVEAMKTGGNEGFLISFACNENDIQSYYRLNLGGWGNTQSAIEKCSDKGGSVVTDFVPTQLENNRWYNIKIAINGNHVDCYLDGTKLLSYEVGSRQSGRLQSISGYDATNGEVVLKVVNGTKKAWTPVVRLNAKNINSSAKVITLTSDSRLDENSFDNPTKIVPVESTAEVADSFSYTFPAYSLTFLRIKAEPADTAMTIPAFQFDTAPKSLAVEDEMQTFTHEENGTTYTYTLGEAVTSTDQLLSGRFGLVNNSSDGILYFYENQDAKKGLFEDDAFCADFALSCKIAYLADQEAYSIEVTYPDSTYYEHGIGGGHYLNTSTWGVSFMGTCEAPQYGTDAQDHALWLISYNAEKGGFLIQSKGRTNHYLNWDENSGNVYTSATPYYWRLRPITKAESTGITSVDSNKQAPTYYYNVAGMRSSHPWKGLNIMDNGKKAIFK